MKQEISVTFYFSTVEDLEAFVKAVMLEPGPAQAALARSALAAPGPVQQSKATVDGGKVTGYSKAPAGAPLCRNCGKPTKRIDWVDKKTGEAKSAFKCLACGIWVNGQK